MRGRPRFVLVIAAIVPLALVLVGPQLLLLALIRARVPGARVAAGWLPVLFHRTLLSLAGIRVRRDGALAHRRPLLVAANHVSWLDIVVLGSLAPLSFVAKDEMRSWPVFGWLARLQRTVFIARDRRRTVSDQADRIADRLNEGAIVVLFPEGTTSDGHDLLPFKSALFEAARFALVAGDLDEGAVQPVALDYAAAAGMPLGRVGRARFAWPGEIGLGESLAATLDGTGLDVVVRCAEPIRLTPQSSRKVVSARAHAAIRTLLARAAPALRRLDTAPPQP